MKKYSKKVLIASSVLVVILVIIGLVICIKNKENNTLEEFEAIEELRFDNYVIRIKDYVFDEGTGYGNCEFVIECDDLLEITTYNMPKFNGYVFGINEYSQGINDVETKKYDKNIVKVKVKFYSRNVNDTTRFVVHKAGEFKEIAGFELKDTVEVGVYLENSNGDSINIAKDAIRICKNSFLRDELMLAIKYKDGSGVLLAKEVLDDYEIRSTVGQCLIISKTIEKIDIENIDTIEYEDDVYTVR